MRQSASAKHNPEKKARTESADERVLERSDNVLWTIAPPGILLHNFARRRFLELDEVGYKAWGYLDGARTVDEVVARCTESAGADPKSKVANIKKVHGIVQTLFAHGFVEERKHA